jgi:DNA-binding NtrC family response regulator
MGTDLLNEKKIKVLIVDDEPDVLETLEDLLFMFEVSSASTFEEAGDLLENRYFDMAILDIMGVNGYKLLEIAKEKEVIAVMLTANAVNPKHVIKSYKEGAAFYVPKDEMGNITTYLEDILEAREKGKHPWRHWMERIGNSYCKRKFGSNWQENNKEFWEKFEYMRE